jgi:hypothetical protein
MGSRELISSHERQCLRRRNATRLGGAAQTNSGKRATRHCFAIADMGLAFGITGVVHAVPCAPSITLSSAMI